jgi:metal-responsive CopG/Arc/MetJ family transcriptional regulator
MFKTTIKLNKELYEKVKRCAGAAGYSSADEFVIHVLEKELARIYEDEQSDEEIVRKLKGLGYLE